MIIRIEFANNLKKSAKSNNAFDVKSMIMSTKFVETMKNAISARASILRLNAEQSTNTENVLTASTSTLREAFNATLKRKRSKDSTRYETTNRSCTSKHRQMKKQRRQKIDFTSSRSRRFARSQRFNKR
jgi:anti-sigma28 factor (negative regulator of flagellin synthesis)